MTEQEEAKFIVDNADMLGQQFNAAIVEVAERCGLSHASIYVLAGKVAAGMAGGVLCAMMKHFKDDGESEEMQRTAIAGWCNVFSKSFASHGGCTEKQISCAVGWKL